MKKIYPLSLLLCLFGICSYVFSSCSNDDADSAPTEAPGNTLAYGDAQSEIQSVIYTVDEKKVYTFYFSPTKGIVDLEAMLLADDYLKIVTSTPTGPVDLLSANNMLSYRDVLVSSATADQVSNATLSLQLTSLFTAKMSLDIRLSSGQRLRAEFHEVCTRLAQDDVTEDGSELVFTKKIFSYYMGPQKRPGTDCYYIALTNVDYTGQGTQFKLNEKGYALLLSFYGTPNDNWLEFPTGRFNESEHMGDHTYYNDYSFVYHFDGVSKVSACQLLDPVVVEKQGDEYVVTATFRDLDQKKRTLSYRGSLRMLNGMYNTQLPQLLNNIVVDGAYIQSAKYQGDVLDNGSGAVELTIIDRKGANDEPNGSGMNLVLFGPKFNDPKRDRNLTPGIYTLSAAGEQGTWMPGTEGNIMGMIYPAGTYAAYDDGTKEGQYSYACEGIVEIRQGSGKNIFTIDFDLVSIHGYKIQGSYTGDVFLQDASSDKKNDGSSTLESDYEVDLSHHTRADLAPQTHLYVSGNGFGLMPLEEVWKWSDGRKYGYQLIKIGTEKGTYEPSWEYPTKGKLVEGDMFTIELLVEEGTSDKITPGYYKVTAERWPAYFAPGVCVRGRIAPTGIEGSAWKRVTSAIGWGKPAGYYDPDYMVKEGWLNVPTIENYAAIYAGMIKVSKAEGGDNWYTFEFQGEDVVNHKVTGSWTGPVYLAGTDTPVEDSGLEKQAVQQRNTVLGREVPSYSEMKRENALPEYRIMLNRKSLK